MTERDDAALRPALDAWAERVQGVDPRRDPRPHPALLGLGAGRYGRNAPAEAETAWRGLDSALAAAYREAHDPSTTAARLPPLNPARHDRTQ